MRPCPLCSTTTPAQPRAKVCLVGSRTYDLVECGTCGVLCFAPMPGVEELAAFYNADYYDFDRWREEGKGMSFAHRLTRIKERGRFLDVGCATGFFINGIQKNSRWDVAGTDFGESAVRFAKETLGLDVRQGELTDIGFPDAHFDFVHVNNVLEHVRDPGSLLRECRRIVAPDGYMYLSVPNGTVDSRDLIDFHTETGLPSRSKSGHVFFFPSRTLLREFERAGFTVERARTYSLKRGMRSMGWLPRKSDWKRDHYPREAPAAPPRVRVVDTAGTPPHSSFYYRARFLQGSLHMLPGLHDIGLDFLFLLRPGTPR